MAILTIIDLLVGYAKDTEEIDLLHLKIRSITALDFTQLPNLRRVCLRQNLITSLDGLEDLPSTLDELDLYDNRFNHINHLSHFKDMTSLDMSFNKIRHIKNIGHLVHLKFLYLCQNKITQIENLSTLTKITYLELGANRIRVSWVIHIDNSKCANNFEENRKPGSSRQSRAALARKEQNHKA